MIQSNKKCDKIQIPVGFLAGYKDWKNAGFKKKLDFQQCLY